MRRGLFGASLLVTILAAMLAPGAASAGQIVYVRAAGGSSYSGNLWVMNENGSEQRMLLAENQNGDGVNSLSQPNLLPSGVNLAFQGATNLAAGGCGVNCIGAYTLIGGVVRRISAAVVPCPGTINGSCATEDIDNSPTLTDDGRILYLHTGTAVGFECGFYCGIYAASGNSYIIQSDVGGDIPNTWPLPPSENTWEKPAEQGGVASVPAADPANPGFILYAGIEDNGCGDPKECHPLVVDNSSGSSYIVSDDDTEQGDYTWSPNGEYIADIEGGNEPGIWVYRNAKETSANVAKELWYVMETPPKTASGGGFTGGLAVTNSGSLIFSSGNDIYSLPDKECWGAGVKQATGKATCTLAEATQLTTSAMDIDPTWTESTQPIVVNAPAPGPHSEVVTPVLTSTPALSGVSETNATWREGNALASFARKHLPPIGTTFSFSLSEAASVKLEFTQSAAGRKVGRSCVAQTKKNKHKRHCTRTIVAGTLTDAAHAGVNKVHFDGPVSRHKKLAPGSYVLLISATAAGKESAVSRLHFTIARS